VLRRLAILSIPCTMVFVQIAHAAENSQAGVTKTQERLAEDNGDSKSDAVPARLGERGRSICPLLDPVAAAHGLPGGFFARLIWQESRFQDDAISPKGAQGIAQFMPGTAAMRGLDDPFEPISALAASGAYLAELHREFGNLGLAAAAYNSGEQRVRDWLAGRQASLPLETQNYVARITGRTVEDWRDGASAEPVNFDAGDEAATACQSLAVMLEGLPDASEQLAPAAPWGVQIAGGFSRTSTLAAFDRVRRQFSPIIGEMQPIMRQTLDRGRGRRVLHQARVGAASREEGERLCARLRQAGGSCVVLRN
jgi:hypothetical protein